MEENQNTKILRIMSKLDRLAAWILFFTIIAYGITGYGLTKGLISRDLAASLHLGWLGALGLTAFTIHTGYAIHLALRSWGKWNKLSQTILFLGFIGLISFFVYAQFFFNTTPTQTTRAPQTTENIFNAQSLAKYNGKNGNPSYIAVDGLVYDVSTLFINGEHRGCYAGGDVSAAFHDQHSSQYLQRFPIIGKYQD